MRMMQGNGERRGVGGDVVPLPWQRWLAGDNWCTRGGCIAMCAPQTSRDYVYKGL